MPNVTVRDRPDDVHSVLQQRAADAGQSLQQYLSDELGRLARRPTIDEVLGRIEQHSGGRIGLSTAVDDLDTERRSA